MVTQEQSTDHIARALAEMVSEPEYDDQGNWLFPQMTRRASVDLLNRICDETGLPPVNCPINTAQLVRLAQQLDYDAKPHTPQNYCLQGMVRNVEKDPRLGFRFMPEHIIQLLAVLEFRQRWMPDSPMHDGKKSHWRVMREKSQASEQQEVLEKIKSWPLGDMVRVIAEAPDRQARLALKEGLIWKLRSMGVHLQDEEDAELEELLK